MLSVNALTLGSFPAALQLSSCVIQADLPISRQPGKSGVYQKYLSLRVWNLLIDLPQQETFQPNGCSSLLVTRKLVRCVGAYFSLDWRQHRNLLQDGTSLEKHRTPLRCGPIAWLENDGKLMIE